MKITFIGLGKMGTAMVERLLQSGYSVTIFNRTAEKMEPLVAQGAVSKSTMSAAVAGADIVMTMLLDDQAVLNVSTELLQSMSAQAIHISLATILPETASKLALQHQAQQQHYVSATVVGVPEVVRQGQLTTFCAGESEVVSQVMPLLQAFSSQVTMLGQEITAPNVMKICVNYSLITTLELISELYVFAEKSGLDTHLVKNLLHEIYGHSAFKRYIDKIHARDFSQVNFDMVGGNKDVHLFQVAFAKAGVSPEIANIVRSRFINALASGMQDKDWSGIYEIVRAQAGLPGPKETDKLE